MKKKLNGLCGGRWRGTTRRTTWPWSPPTKTRCGWMRSSKSMQQWKSRASRRASRSCCLLLLMPDRLWRAAFVCYGRASTDLVTKGRSMRLSFRYIRTIKSMSLWFPSKNGSSWSPSQFSTDLKLLALFASSWQLREHRHMALEAVYAPPQFKLLEKHAVNFVLDPDILRR